MIADIERGYLLSSGYAEHKARLATCVIGLPIVLGRVTRREPNQLWNTEGLSIQKYKDFWNVWDVPDDWWEGRSIAGSADVNVGHQVQGDKVFTLSRKVNVEGKNMIDDLAMKVGGMAVMLGKKSTVVSRVEAGVTFARRFGKKRVARLTAVARMHITQPGNPMADKVLLKDYFQWSGLGEKHAGMPWGIDWLSWVAFLICQNQTQGLSANEMVRLPKSMSDMKYDPRGFDVFRKLGRLDDEWIKHVEPHIALGLLQFGSNFPQPIGDVIAGGLSRPGDNDRVVYVH